MQKAIFFDRDGVINKDSNYVYKIEEFMFYRDCFEAFIYFKQKGYKLIVITNQSGIQRGYYTIIDFLKISKYMQDMIYTELGFYLDRIYFCPLLHDDIRRKPAPGMILQAQKDFSLNLAHSYLVGDKMSDIEAGINANIPNLFLLQRITQNTQDCDNITYSKDSQILQNQTISTKSFTNTSHHNVSYHHIPTLYDMITISQQLHLV